MSGGRRSKNFSDPSVARQNYSLFPYFLLPFTTVTKILLVFDLAIDFGTIPGPQQVGTDGQKNFLFINLRCKGNNKSSTEM